MNVTETETGKFLAKLHLNLRSLGIRNENDLRTWRSFDENFKLKIIALTKIQSVVRSFLGRKCIMRMYDDITKNLLDELEQLRVQKREATQRRIELSVEFQAKKNNH